MRVVILEAKTNRPKVYLSVQQFDQIMSQLGIGDQLYRYTFNRTERFMLKETSGHTHIFYVTEGDTAILEKMI